MSTVATAPIAEALALLHEPDSVFEIRIPKAGRAGTIAGYFNDVEKAAAAIARYDHKVPGIYVTLNPVNPALLARAANACANLPKRPQATAMSSPGTCC